MTTLKRSPFCLSLSLSIAASLVAGCMVGDGTPYDDGQDVSNDAAGSVFGISHGLNVDPANEKSRPCGDLDAQHLHVTGFVRMPLKFSSDDGWSWKNGEFQAYLACLRTTLPGIKIIGTLNESSVDPTAGVPHNPYLAKGAGSCDVNKPVGQCGAFEIWLDAYLDKISPTLMKQFDIIEVFNEPDDKWNGSEFTAGATSSMPPTAYAELLNRFYRKFRGPIGRPIMMGGMDSGVPGYLAEMGEYSSDFLNIHPYTVYPTGAAQNFVFDQVNHTCTSSNFGKLAPCFGTMENNIRAYKQESADEGHNAPMIISEWGVKTGSQQPGLIHAFFADPLTRGTNAAMFAYSDANQAGFGLTTTSDVPKLGYTAFQNP